jgi:hypothetical protein
MILFYDYTVQKAEFEGIGYQEKAFRGKKGNIEHFY